MRLGLTVALVITIFLLGCRKQPDATSADASPGSATASSASEASNASATALAQPDNSAAILAQLTQTLRKFSVENQRVPKTLAELESAGYLTSMPPAPVGLRYSIDAKHVQVILVKQ